MRLQKPIKYFASTTLMIFGLLSIIANGCNNNNNNNGPKTYSISGQVTSNATGLSGVTIALSGAGSGTTTTDSNGDYSFSGLSNGSYTLTPSLTGYTFDPISRNVAVSGANTSGVDFIASPSVSETIGPEGGAVEVTDLDSPLYGVKVVIPKGALSSSETISISQVSNPPLDHSGMEVAGDGISIDSTVSNLNTYADITLIFDRSLVDLPEDLLVVSYDPSSGLYDVAPIIAIDEYNGLVTVRTTHFSWFFPVGLVVFDDSVSTNFTFNTDVFPIKNFVSCPISGRNHEGHCTGMVAFSQWYVNEKGHGLKTFSPYQDESIAKQLACDAHEVMNPLWSGFIEIIPQTVSAFGNFDLLTAQSMIAAMKLTNRPQRLMISNWSAGHHHTVLIYAWENPYFYIYDPNDINNFHKIKYDIFFDPYEFEGKTYYTFFHDGVCWAYSIQLSNIYDEYLPISDTTPPSAPTALTATAVSSSQISLSWTASTDDVGVTGYKVYRDGSYLKSVTSTSTSDTGLSSSTQYCYTVLAYDAAGNESDESDEACATTSSDTPSDTNPPTISQMADQEVRTGSNLSLLCTVNDPDTPFDDLLVSIEGPSGIDIWKTLIEGTVAIYWEPSQEQIGTHLVTITVSDGYNIVTETFDITVFAPPNDLEFPESYPGAVVISDETLEGDVADIVTGGTCDAIRMVEYSSTETPSMIAEWYENLLNNNGWPSVIKACYESNGTHICEVLSSETIPAIGIQIDDYQEESRIQINYLFNW